MHVVVSRRVAGAALVGLGVAATVTVGLIYLPRATITLHPATQERTVNQEIVLSVSAKEPDFKRFVLPTERVERELSEQQAQPREGATRHQDYARGHVVLHNEQDTDQSLLPKTHLLHEATGVFFLTDAPAKIPAHGTVAVTVTAKEKGSSGNVLPGKFIVDKLPPALQASVYGVSEAALTGGEAVDQPVTEAELAAAREAVRHALTTRSLGELTAAAGGAPLNEGLVQLTAIEETVSAEVGSKTAAFSVSMKAKAHALVVNENDILSLTLLALRTAPDEDWEFAGYNPTSFRLEVERVDVARGTATVTGHLTGTLARKISPQVLRTDNLAGRTVAQIREYFVQFPSVGDVEVRLWPFWVRRVPGRAGAVEVVVTQANVSQ